MKNIVIIGGGTGTSTLLQGLKKYPVDLSVIVSTADDGGSTGILRRELGVVPPGDIRQCLLALSNADEEVKDLFNLRFFSGSLKGHNAGNIILAGLEKITGNIGDAISMAADLLKAKGSVYPVTVKPTTLTAVLRNGKKIIGEHNIDEPRGNLKLKIKNLKLEPNQPANHKALMAIKSADVIVFGPGDLYTSTIPNFLVKGIREAVNKSKAKKVFISNIMTKHGQTDGFKASDFVRELKRYLQARINVVLVNNKRPDSKHLLAYKQELAEFVEPDLKTGDGLRVIAANFISKEVFKKSAGDSLKRSMIRHDSKKLAKIIWGLI
jgi:uncharacterized cofD-like protein